MSPVIWLTVLLFVAMISAATPVHILKPSSKSTSGVCGVTSLRNEVYIAHQRSNQIDVYDAASVSHRRHLVLPFKTFQGSLAACSKNNCIYVTSFSYKYQGIFKADAEGHQPASRWAAVRDARGLTVDRETGNVLVVCCDSVKIQEFADIGKLVREIDLQPSGITHPLNVLRLSKDELGVTHAGARHRFCIVGLDGRVIRSYGDQPGCGTGQLFQPYGLAVGEPGTVYIACSEYHSLGILMLNLSTFETALVDMAIPDHCRMKFAFCLHYDRARRRLYIGEATGECRLIVVVNGSVSEQYI